MSRFDDVVDSGLRQFLSVVDDLEHYHLAEYVVAGCESEIEKLMAVAMALMEVPMLFNSIEYPYTRPTFTRLKYPAAELVALDEYVACYKQAEILNGRYRADFLLAAKFQDREAPLEIVIECDGHDFHERTKDQAKRDRGRDRAMTAAGYKVFRFTGSEIYRDPFKCAAEVGEYLKNEECRTRPRES